MSNTCTSLEYWVRNTQIVINLYSTVMLRVLKINIAIFVVLKCQLTVWGQYHSFSSESDKKCIFIYLVYVTSPYSTPLKYLFISHRGATTPVKYGSAESIIIFVPGLISLVLGGLEERLGYILLPQNKLNCTYCSLVRTKHLYKNKKMTILGYNTL